MANALIAKRATTSDLFRASFAFLRGLSTSPTAATATSSAAAGGGVKKPKQKQKKIKNLFEVTLKLPNWGIGCHVAKTHCAEVSYELTRINLYKDRRHGKAWGIAHKNGTPIEGAPRKIGGVHKRYWRYIPMPKKIEEKAPEQEASVPKPEVSVPKQEHDSA